jgi:peptidyl-dipeptidase A
MKTISPRLCAFALTLLLASAFAPHLTPAQQSTAPTPDEAKRFIEHSEAELTELGLKASRAAWVQVNFITYDTENIASDAEEAANTAATNYAKLAHRYDKVPLSPELARKRLLLELATDFPAPDDPKAQKELAGILTSLEGDYGKGKWCPDGDAKPCLDITKIERLLATSRDPEELKRAWIGWHAVGAPMRDRYARMVELGNAGSRELGYTDVGALWRSKYDMPPDDFARELDRVWEQLRPLYLSLHAYVRGQLAKKYG